MKRRLLIPCLVCLAVAIVSDAVAQMEQEDSPAGAETPDEAPGGGALIMSEPATLDDEPSSEVIDQQAQSAYTVEDENIPLGDAGMDDEALEE